MSPVVVSRVLREHVVDTLAVLFAAWNAVRPLVEPFAHRPVVVLVSPLTTLPLLLRRRFPLAAPVLGLLALLVLSALAPGAIGNQMQVFAAAMLVFWVVGSENRLRLAAAGLAIGLVVTVIGTELDRTTHLDDLIFATLTFSGSWVAGAAFGRRAAEAARLRVESAERSHEAAEALARERARISRDVHDVVAHSIGLMVVQLGAADSVLERDADAARSSIRAAREVGKHALTELRNVLSLLQDDDVPTRAVIGLSGLAALTAEMAKAGVRVEVRVLGRPRDLPPGLDQTAYRVVQESLTNVLKHASSRAADVVLDWGESELTLTVRSMGGDAHSGHPDDRWNLPGSGRGLAGMQARVQLYGGRFFAGPVQDTYKVRADLPLAAGTR
jgi:signal transduction histidine kinase